MHLFLLHELSFGAIPEEIEVIQSYGAETIVMADSINTVEQMIHGTSVHLSGTSEAFKRWLGGKAVWYTESPMLGQWQRQVISSLEN